MNYFFENINAYSESAKQEIFNFIERYGDNSILKKISDAVIKSGDMEMASCAMSNKICMKYLKPTFKDIFLYNINSSDINISITCIQSLDKFYFNRSYVDNFYNLLNENINKDIDNLAMKKQICSLYKAIDKYFDINSNYLCCYNSVDCTHEELKKIFYGVESRIKNRKKWYREIISE